MKLKRRRHDFSSGEVMYLPLFRNPESKRYAYSCVMLKIPFCSHVIQMWMTEDFFFFLSVSSLTDDLLLTFLNKKSPLFHEEFLVYLSESTKLCLLILHFCLSWLALDLRQNSELLYLFFNRSEGDIKSYLFLKLW